MAFITASSKNLIKDKLVIVNRKNCPKIYSVYGYIYYVYRVKSVYDFLDDSIAECYPVRAMDDVPDYLGKPDKKERYNFELEHLVPFEANNKLYGSLMLDREL